MQFYSPDRPEVSPNVPAILIDGSALPYMVCRPEANGSIRLACLLRCYDSTEAYSYGYRETFLQPEELANFFRAYADNPEQALSFYFRWTAQKPGTRSTSAIKVTGPKILPSADFNDALDLL